MSTNPEQDVVEVDVEDWIDGVSFLQTTVTLHRNPAMWAEYEPLLAELADLQGELEAYENSLETDEQDESSLGEPSTVRGPEIAGEESLGDIPEPTDTEKRLRTRIAQLEDKAGELYAKYDADAEVWYIRQLDLAAEMPGFIEAAGGLPVKPDPVSKDASKSAKATYNRKMREWRDAMPDATHEVNLHAVAAAVMKVVVAGVERPAPSVDGLRRLYKRPHGREHFGKLYEATERLAQQVEIAAPHRSGS